LSTEIGVHGGRAAVRAATEHDADRRDPEARQIKPEDVRVVLVHWLERKAAERDRDGGQQADPEPATAHEHLDAAAEHESTPEVGDPRLEDVATAEVSPDLRVMGNGPPLDVTRDSEEVPHEAVELDL
jgi:hypothetical protein